MIYIKIQKDVYNNLSLDKFIKDYPNFARRYLALHRIIWHTLQNELKDYPDIDIVISDKKQNNVLGRLFLNKIQGHKEYKFILQKTGIPYIVLYPDHILRYFYNHKVKGFKEVFLHEFLHFRQWLLNERLEHNRDLKASDDNLKVNNNLKTFTEILNNKRG
jgi:uncharacterized protein (UPF0248 family)